MSFVKTLTNGWHTSSRMHEATCLPCVFGCNSLPSNTLALSTSVEPASSTQDETAHYLICPILVGIISQASGLDHLPNLHELVLGKDINDFTGALACAIGYHIHHSLEFGKMLEILKAVENSMFSYICAYDFSAARAFLNDFDI